MISRNETLDNIRGVAILLMILTHGLIAAHLGNFYSNIIIKIVYSFHMPVFFIISGYLYKQRKLSEVCKTL